MDSKLWTWRERDGVGLSASESEGRCLWAELCPPQICILKSQLPVPRNVTIWRWGVSRGDSGKMRLYGWTLIQHDRCPYEKWKLGHGYAQKEDHIKTEGDCHGELSRNSPADALILDFSSPEP